MRRILVLCVVLAGCGGGKPARAPISTPIATDATATPVMLPASSGPWSSPAKAPGEPLRCPVASSRAGSPDRVLVLPGGRMVRFAQLAPSMPADVGTRVHACGADGRAAGAWIEEDGGGGAVLRLALQLPGRQLGAPVTIAAVADESDDFEISDAALAFAPDGELLVVWAEVGRVRAVTLSAAGARGRDVTLGKASDLSVLGAEIAANGRAVVAWTTQDAGEERNQPHVIRAAMRPRGGLFERARTVDPGQAVDPEQFAHDPQSGLRLAVGADGRALLQWGTLTRRCCFRFNHPVRLAAASPRGRFGAWRTLSGDGSPGDVALRDDGTPLVVWEGDGAVLAAVRLGGEPKLLDRGDPAKDFTAAFLSDGRAEVSWEGPGGRLVAIRRSP